MKSTELKEIDIKNCACSYCDIIKFEDFDFDNILIELKSNKRALVTDI